MILNVWRNEDSEKNFSIHLISLLLLLLLLLFCVFVVVVVVFLFHSEVLQFSAFSSF